VQISTDEVYGTINEGSWDERCPLLPNSPYSASKASADLLARSYHQTYGMDVRITRCSNNYGPHQFPEKIVPLFITNLFHGKKVPLYGSGNNVRDWLHVDDHCRGIHAVLIKGKSGDIYNIGGGRELTNIELTSIILEKMGKDISYIEFVKDRLGHDFRYSVSIRKISSELGYEPQVQFEEGIEQTIDWYKSNEKWWLPLKK
jgi:dTDP-glucose 4,6-dehydratase